MSRIVETTRRLFATGIPRWAAVPLCGLAVVAAGCGAINVGEWKGVVFPEEDEHHWLIREALLTAGSVAHARDNFDHSLQPVVRCVFRMVNETNNFVTKTVWIAPSGQEFRVIRKTHSQKEVEDQGMNRPKEGTVVVHSMPTQELYDFDPGLWTVEIYVNKSGRGFELARRLKFTVR